MAMRWEDERYIRFYVRDTITWKLLNWQAKCVMGPIMRKLDRAGVLALSGAGVDGIAALIEVPIEVVAPGVADLVKRGVMALADEYLVMPNFLEAQEARSSDKARKQKERELARDAARLVELTAAQSVTKRDEPSQNVTKRHDSSHGVTPSLAVPCSTEPLKDVAQEAAPPLALSPPPVPKPKRRKADDAPPPDPRHHPLKLRLIAACEDEGHGPLPWDGFQAKALTGLLAIAPPEEIETRWRRALRRSGFPTVRKPSELREHWTHFASDAPKARSNGAPLPPSDFSRYDPNDPAQNPF